MKLYNTLTRKTEELKPVNTPTVTVYTCGPTVYDYSHIGHWFTYVRWDLLVRTLRASGLQPKWVMNITDVGHLVSDADEGEDKLEKGAKREGKTAWEVAKFYTNDFLDGMAALNMLTPSQMPKATDHIAEQIELIKKLEEKGFTYVIRDGVYYDTSKFPTYADFAKLDLEEQQAGARVEINPEKRNQTDFALWKFSPAGQKRDMEWWSPWEKPDQTSDEKHAVGAPRASHLSAESVFSASSAGSRIEDTASEQHSRKTDSAPKAPEQDELVSAGSGAVRGSWGFPGWHIECSAMSMKYLGDTLDIHTGGIDHVPVHHTNEIAQSEAVTGKPFANIWLHSNHVMVNDQKISKSLGNGIRLQEVAQKGYSPMVVRLHVLESHYRSQSKFSWDSLEAAKNRLQGYQALAVLRFQANPDAALLGDNYFDDLKASVLEALGNDLNTPEVLRILNEAADYIDSHGQGIHPSRHLDQFTSFLRFIDDTLGLQLSTIPDISEKQKQLIAAREEARIHKNWGKADELRGQLEKQGIGLRDTTAGPIWYKLS